MVIVPRVRLPHVPYLGIDSDKLAVDAKSASLTIYDCSPERTWRVGVIQGAGQSPQLTMLTIPQLRMPGPDHANQLTIQHLVTIFIDR